MKRMTKRVLAVAAGLSMVASAQGSNYCRVCNDVPGIESQAKQHGCANYVSQLERGIADALKDNPGVDLTKARALLERCKQDQKQERLANGVRAFSFDVDSALNIRFHSCLTSPTGCRLEEASLASLEAPAMLKLIKEWAASSDPDQANRGKKALEAYEALKPKLAAKCAELTALAEDFLKSAKERRSDSPLFAEEQLERGLKACGYATTYDPDYKGCAKVKGGLEAMKADFEKQRDATVYKGDAFHKANAGKALLATSTKNIETNTFTTTLKAGEPAWLVGAFRDLIGSLAGDLTLDAVVTVRLEVGGKDIGAGMVAVDAADVKTGVSMLELVPTSVADAANYEFSSDLVGPLSELEPGQHEVKVQFIVSNSAGDKVREAATGAFTYDATAGQDAMKTLAAALAGRVLDDARMPAPEKNDPKLVTAMTKALAKNEFGDKVLRMVITDSDFTITRDDWTKRILRRSIHTATAVKKKDGTCMVQRIEFAQQFDGRGYLAPTASYASGEYDIRCENVNKK